MHVLSLAMCSHKVAVRMHEFPTLLDMCQPSCRKFHRQVAAGYDWQQGDIQWSQRNSILYPAVSSLAGLVAGMFGVGGGIVKASLPTYLHSINM